MKQIKKYLSEDSVEFDTKKECINYEKKALDIKAIIKLMPKLPKDKDYSYANGEGFIQWEKFTYIRVRERVLKLAYIFTRENIYLESLGGTHCRGIVGRYFDDSDDPKIKKLQEIWWRLMKTDKEYKEWGQYFFALHPEKGKHIKLN